MLESFLPMIVKALGLKPEWVESQVAEAMKVVSQFRDEAKHANIRLGAIEDNQRQIMRHLGMIREAEIIELNAARINHEQVSDQSESDRSIRPDDQRIPG